MDDNSCAKSEFHKTLEFNDHVEEGKREMMDEWDDDIDDQIFEYEACKFDQLRIEDEGPICKKFFAPEI
jgi:hypothetical protein